MTATLEIPAPVTETDDDDFSHIYCCDPDWSLCGRDISGLNDIGSGPDPVDCVVCDAMDGRPCGRAGCIYVYH